MSEAVTLDDQHYQRQYQSAVRREEPGFIDALREAGIERFERLGLPIRRQEDWRFTDLSAFSALAFEREGAAPVEAKALPSPLLSDGFRLVFVNGHHSAALSHSTELPNGVIIASLQQAMSEYRAVLEPYFGQTPGLDDNAFCALNDALFDDGAFIYVPSGKALAQPIELVFWNTGAALGAAYPRNLIVLEAGSQASIVESHLGKLCDESYFCCPQTELKLGRDALCHYHKLQEESPSAYHFGGVRMQLAAGSQAQCHLLSTRGKLNRTDLYTRLDGPGTDCSIDGLTLLQDGEVGDYHLRVEHAEPQGSSRQLFKSVVDGKARAVFDGLIKVNKDAQHTDASQTCRNLLLSKRAVAHANPRLEILADDVKCAHGATVGFLDPDALFYLRARGIRESQARAMLVYAFANEQIKRIKLAPLRKRLEHLLHERFYPEDTRA